MCISDLERAEVIGRGIVVDRRGRVVLGSAYGDHEYMRKYRGYHLLLAHRALPWQKLGHVMPLQHLLAGNYFHWVLESLGRLAMFEDSGGRAGMQYLVDSNAPAFVRDSLKVLFGITADCLVPMEARRVKTDRVRYVSFPHVIRPGRHNINVYRPQAIQRLAQVASQRLQLGPGAAEALIVLREAGSGREITDHERIIERFPGLNWRTIRLREMPFLEQAKAFAGARIIVATHGAGLANLVFARQANVIEFFPAHRKALDSSYFVQISGALDMPHTIIGYPSGPQENLIITDEVLSQMRIALGKSLP